MSPNFRLPALLLVLFALLSGRAQAATGAMALDTTDWRRVRIVDDSDPARIVVQDQYGKRKVRNRDDLKLALAKYKDLKPGVQVLFFSPRENSADPKPVSSRVHAIFEGGTVLVSEHVYREHTHGDEFAYANERSLLRTIPEKDGLKAGQLACAGKDEVKVLHLFPNGKAEIERGALLFKRSQLVETSDLSLCSSDRRSISGRGEKKLPIAETVESFESGWSRSASENAR